MPECETGTLELARRRPLSPRRRLRGLRLAGLDGGRRRCVGPAGLADSSLALERWHNVEGHMVVGQVTGRGMDMMEPLINIFLPEFGRLHHFINERFEEQLPSHAQGAHPDLRLNGAGEIIDHVEGSHHGALAFI